MMQRREFLGAVGAGLLAAPLPAGARQHRLRRIGLLEPGTIPAETKQWPPPLMAGLRDLGWIEGQNIPSNAQSLLLRADEVIE